MKFDDLQVKCCMHCSKNVSNFSSAKEKYYAGIVITTNEDNTCEKCGTNLTNTDIKIEDFMTIMNVSNFNRQLLDAMIELKQKDIIEYEIKMSQFRNQAEQKNIIENKKSDDNTPKCPKCGSTSIQIVPRKWSLLGGFATKKTDRVCVNCKYKW